MTTRASVCGDGASPSFLRPSPSFLRPLRRSCGGRNLASRGRGHPSFQRRLESRRAARGGSVGGEGIQPPVIPAEAGIQARSARRGGWGRGYSATRHSSGGWNPGAQRAAGRLGERVLSHPSFQRRLESRRAARGGAVGGEGTEPPVIPAQAGIQARKRSVGRLGERVLSHPSFQWRLESRRAAHGGVVGGEGTQPPVIPAEAGIQARSARRGSWGRGYSATRHSSRGWNPGAQALGGATGR